MSKDVFESIRVSTLSVTSPLLELLRLRSDIIKQMRDYIVKLPDNLEKYEILQRYNEYAHRDADMAEIVKGRMDELPSR